MGIGSNIRHFWSQKVKIETKDTDRVIYPSQYETEIVLNDGSAMVLRPIKIDDVESWLAFLSRLGTDSKYLWSPQIPTQMTPEEALRFCTVDYNNVFALVGEVIKQNKKEIVAIGRYYRLPKKNSADVVLVIEDAYRRKGIGIRLLEVSCKCCAAIMVFPILRLMSPRKMKTLWLFSKVMVSTLPVSLRPIHYTLPFLSHRQRKYSEKKKKGKELPTIASIRNLLCPQSVALIGASRYPGTIGYIMLRCISARWLYRDGVSG